MLYSELLKQRRFRELTESETIRMAGKDAEQGWREHCYDDAYLMVDIVCCLGNRRRALVCLCEIVNQIVGVDYAPRILGAYDKGRQGQADLKQIQRDFEGSQQPVALLAWAAVCNNHTFEQCGHLWLGDLLDTRAGKDAAVRVCRQHFTMCPAL